MSNPSQPQGQGSPLRQKMIREMQLQRLSKLTIRSYLSSVKAPFAGPRKLLDYLRRYTHRVALSNQRLLACHDGKVTFSYRDRTDGDRRKQMVLPAQQFIGRFLSHVLPDRFTRIRPYGFLSNGHRRAKLAVIREQLGVIQRPPTDGEDSLQQWIREVLGIEWDACPCCGDRLVPTKLLPQRPVIQLCRPRKHSRGPPKKAPT